MRSDLHPPGTEAALSPVPAGRPSAPSIHQGPVSVNRPIRSLRRNVVWTLAGDGVYAACQWGMLIVIAKIGSAEMLGQFALGLAITAPVIFLAGLALRSVLVTDAESDYEFGEYLALRLATTACALAVIGGVALIAGYRTETSLVILGLGLAKGMEAVSEIYYGLFQRHERMDLIATSLMIKGPLSLAALTAVLFFSGSIVWGAIGVMAIWGLVLLTYDARVGTGLVHRMGNGQGARPQWRSTRLTRLTWVAWPLGCTLMLVSFNYNIPRYFLEHYLGERSLGIFAAVAHLMLAGSTLMNAFEQTASPRLARYWAEGRRSAFRTLLFKLVGLGGLLGLAGMIVALTVGRDILALLYQPEYTAWVDVLLWLMVVGAVGYVASAFGYGLTAARVFWLQPVQLACATAAGAVACFLLIPSQGLKGAAWAMGISLTVQLVIAVGGTGYFLRGSARVPRQDCAAGPQVPIG